MNSEMAYFVCRIKIMVRVKFERMRHFKVPMKLKIIAAYLKGLLKYRRMAFFFLEHLFLF